jgi:hypothetical protein
MATNEFRWGVEPVIPGHWHGTVNHDAFEIEIASNWIEVRAEDDGNADAQRVRAKEIVEGMVQKIGLDEKTRFNLRLGSTSRFEREANRRDINVFVEEMVSVTVSGHADVVVTAADGTIVSDSRTDRMAELTRFANDSTSNTTLRRMSNYLIDYHADTERKLAPLFDVIELAKEVFGDERNAAASLGIAVQKFKDARRVMNDSSVRTGRHRGQELGPQREPTSAETRLCETVAEQIVTEYTKLVRSGHAPR